MEMNRLAAIGTLIVMFCHSSIVLAEALSPSSLFVADVPVESQNIANRSAAAELGLLDVLVRVSGAETLRFNDDILARTSNAIRYVEQFEYLRDSDIIDTRFSGQTIVRMHFSERLVKRLLSETGQKFWSVNRPSVLVWLVEDSMENGKVMIGDMQGSELVAGLIKGSNYRGIPLQFPLLDFQDQVALGVQRLWALDEEAILEASERYQPEVVLVGKFTTTSSGQIWSNWQFFYNGDSRVYDFRSDQQVQIGEDAIDPLADFLAQKFAVKLSAEDTDYYFAQVNNIRSFGDYQGLMGLLASIDAIGDIVLDGTSDDMVNLRFKSEASIVQITGLLGLNDQLTPIGDSSQSELPVWQRIQPGGSDNPLQYQWSR